MAFYYRMTVFGLALWLSACGGSPPQTPAPKVVEQFYAALKTGDLDSALALYDKDFFNAHPREDWRKTLAALGPLRSMQIDDVQADTRYSGKFYAYKIRTEYESGAKHETLILVWPISRDTIRIVGHQIQP